MGAVVEQIQQTYDLQVSGYYSQLHLLEDSLIQEDGRDVYKRQVEYRMRMKDNQYQWFRASAEVIRRLDGSASRIAGIFINIDAWKEKPFYLKNLQILMHSQSVLIQKIQKRSSKQSRISHHVSVVSI